MGKDIGAAEAGEFLDETQDPRAVLEYFGTRSELDAKGSHLAGCSLVEAADIYVLEIRRGRAGGLRRDSLSDDFAPGLAGEIAKACQDGVTRFLELRRRSLLVLEKRKDMIPRLEVHVDEVFRHRKVPASASIEDILDIVREAADGVVSEHGG